MKKRSLTTLLFISLLSVFIAQAADFDVRRYGAKGDGKKKNTVAIQKAIDACHKAGGGRVVLADGIYMTAPIQLKTGVNLYIDSTARLLASPDIDLCQLEERQARNNRKPTTEEERMSHLCR